MLTQSADRTIRVYNLKQRTPNGANAIVKLASKGMGGSGGNPKIVKMHAGYEVATSEETVELTAADFGISEDGKEIEKKKSGVGKNLFADYTVPSFFRRLSFSPDGNIVLAPAFPKNGSPRCLPACI